MAISNVSLTNTFDEWRVTTNQLIVVTNDLLGDGLQTYRSVTANIVTANNLFFGSLNVVSTLSSAFDKANSANVIAVAAFDRSNIANSAASNAASNSILKTGDTMTGTLVVPTINVSQNLRATGGTIDIAAANILSQTLTDASTISWNTSLGQIATVTLAGNRTLANASSLRVGTYILHVIQDGTGGRTLTFSNQYKFTANVNPTLTSGANRRDLFSFVSDGTNMFGAMIPDVRS